MEKMSLFALEKTTKKKPFFANWSQIVWKEKKTKQEMIRFALNKHVYAYARNNRWGKEEKLNETKYRT